jgi:ribonuclease J
MLCRIHRGTKEIGGSCIEIWTETTRIIIDFGMPLVEKDGSEFNIDKYRNLSSVELIKAGVLPDIKGIYEHEQNLIGGIIISHPHQDHFGLLNYVHPKLKCYLGKATHELIKINKTFTSQELDILNPVYFEKNQSFQIGDIKITPYWADHSAFDAYSFLIEAEGNSIFYSGDFRGHGRKANAFRWFVHNAPKKVDYLLLEGTSVGRQSKVFRNEWNIENDLKKVFSEEDKSNVIYASGQNIDRIVSIYRACIRTSKILVVDVYVATILKTLSQFAAIPYPSQLFDNLRVLYPYYTSRRLAKEGQQEILFQFKSYKITKEEISSEPYRYVLLARPSMRKDFEYICNLDNGKFIYSMWEGYKAKPDTKKFLDFFQSRGFKMLDIHTSGHADIKTLKTMVNAIQPKTIVPIHTFNGVDYKTLFQYPIHLASDGEILG